MSAFEPGELDHLSPERRERLLDLFDVESGPDPADDGLDHVPGEARPVRGPAPRSKREQILEVLEEFNLEPLAPPTGSETHLGRTHRSGPEALSLCGRVGEWEPSEVPSIPAQICDRCLSRLTGLQLGLEDVDQILEDDPPEIVTDGGRDQYLRHHVATPPENPEDVDEWGSDLFDNLDDELLENDQVADEVAEIDVDEFVRELEEQTSGGSA